MLGRSLAAALGALLILMPVLASTASAQRPDRGRDRDVERGHRDSTRADRGAADDWELLGSTRIGGFGVDRDVIDVGPDKGRFERIAFEVRRGAAYILEIRIIFGNDQEQRITVRRRLREGERTPPIELGGDGRPIRRIEIAARALQSPERRRRRAILEVYGDPGDWELLGEERVAFRVDHDVIRVGRREGRFEKIALWVTDNDVEIQDLKVFFRRGPPQDVRVREFIRAGERTRPIDLEGRDRVIDRIELVYRSHDRDRGRATVSVYGLKARERWRPSPPREDWEELGCQKVGFGADRDVIKVGRGEGRFNAIRLRVERSDVVIISLRVVYEHGAPDDFDVKNHIRAGEETRPLDLRGERRAIQQVELVYSSIPSLRGSARLCVDGRQ